MKLLYYKQRDCLSSDGSVAHFFRSCFSFLSPPRLELHLWFSNWPNLFQVSSFFSPCHTVLDMNITLSWLTLSHAICLYYLSCGDQSFEPKITDKDVSINKSLMHKGATHQVNKPDHQMSRFDRSSRQFLRGWNFEFKNERLINGNK